MRGLYKPFGQNTNIDCHKILKLPAKLLYSPEHIIHYLKVISTAKAAKD